MVQRTTKHQYARICNDYIFLLLNLHPALKRLWSKYRTCSKVGQVRGKPDEYTSVKARHVQLIVDVLKSKLGSTSAALFPHSPENFNPFGNTSKLWVKVKNPSGTQTHDIFPRRCDGRRVSLSGLLFLMTAHKNRGPGCFRVSWLGR